MNKLKKASPFIILLFVPITIILSYTFGFTNYAVLSIIVAALSLIACLISIENKPTSLRRLVAVGVMTAISVVGRLIFAPIPGFKPVTAVTVLCAMYFGPSGGFMCGALSALISNLYFGQGPWTPIQMFTWGLIGLIAGILSKPLKNSKIILSIYGAVSGIVYSLILDIWSVQWFSGGFSISLYLAAVYTSLPFMLVYMVSNVIFLLVLNRFCKKGIERIVDKYMD